MRFPVLLFLVEFPRLRLRSINQNYTGGLFHISRDFVHCNNLDSQAFFLVFKTLDVCAINFMERNIACRSESAVSIGVPPALSPKPPIDTYDDSRS